MCVLHEFMCTRHMHVSMEARGPQILWNWSYSCKPPDVGAGTKPKAAARALCAKNC